jgi:hypothetical protein
MAVSPEWFCGVFSELKSVNVVIVNELGVLKHTKKVEVEGPLQQLKSVKNEILKVLGIKSLSKTVISLAIPSTSFQMFVDNESIDTEYLEWKASMFAGNMGSRLVSNQSTFPFSNASMRSEEVLPWKNAIQQENLWVCSVETQQSALFDVLESIDSLKNQNTNLIFSGYDSFVIFKKGKMWAGWNKIDLDDSSVISKLSSEEGELCLFVGAETENISSVSNVKELEIYNDSSKGELKGCFGIASNLAKKYKGTL